ncbi:tyrosine-type recombinase/integrase [Oscillibacter ruminantium]|uniref:tyrosine-type recombinase/integrase n=1 Tax=Oscillibacter ruminantium TaxID=1263547 RepID=UPI000319FCD7|nr:site-specific integrase [Oscillibacter ruminantium]
MDVKKKRYEYKLNLGKTVNGTPLRKSFYSTKSKADAKRRAERFRVQYEMEHCVGVNSYIKTMKFSDWAVSCLEMYKKPFVKANTYAGTYVAPVEKHLIPYFGNMNMDNIKPFHVQKYINDAAKIYSPETIKKDFNALSLIFQTGVDNQFCSSSPMVKSLRMPKYETVTEKQAFSQEQYDKVYEMAKGYENGLPIMVALETGVSRSELLGLRWEDVDIDHALLHINQGLVFYHSEDQGKWVSESNGLKNKYRQRSIPIMDQELLTRLKMLPREIAVGKRMVRPEFVFHSPEGKPFQPNNWVNRVYRPFMDTVCAAYPDIPRLSIHELRHTRATLWIAQGVDPYMVARLLGHSDLKMLTRIYDHTSPETLRAALKPGISEPVIP